MIGFQAFKIIVKPQDEEKNHGADVKHNLKEREINIDRIGSAL